MSKTGTTINLFKFSRTRLLSTLCISAITMILTLSMQGVATAQSGTVFFNQSGDYGNTLTDGMAGSANIPGISYQIYGVNEAGNKVGTILVLAYTGFNLSHYFFVDDGSQLGMPYHKLIIESEGGEAFGFSGFNVFDELGEAPNLLITGLLNGVPVATQSQSLSSGADVVINMSTDFNNVNRIEITNTNGSLLESFNNFVFEAPVSATSPPTVSTDPTSLISSISATLGGNVSDDGGAAVTARGIVWSTNDGFDPATGNTQSMGEDIGSFQESVGLLPFGTNIYFRAWAENSEGISYGDQRSFQTTDSITAQLTGHEGWRLLSVPANVSLSQFLAPIWTQGVISGGNTPNGFPNVYTWNTASTDNSQSWWVPVTDLTNTTLAAGQGVLVYVFSDDNYNQIPDGFPKNLPISGSEFPGPVNASPLNSNENGFTLSGNPFGSPVFWDDVATSGLHDAIYIWSPGETGGTWLTRAGSTGDFDGNIAPFQGFFVQTSTPGSLSLSFVQDNKTNSPATLFYVEPTESRSVAQAVRLDLKGEGLSTSTWLHFSADGTLDSYTKGDAWQLKPLSAEYAVLAVNKEAGQMDISHLPFGQDFEIPLTLESTRSGQYRLQVSQPGSEGISLYLNDLTSGESTKVADGTTLEIFLNQSENLNSGNELFSLNAELLKSAVQDTRFTISTYPLYTTDTEPETSDLPRSLALAQNYPNPFNPVTQIAFELPESAQMKLEVFDLTGRKVATLADGQTQAGRHTITFDASHLSSGIYLYRLQASGKVITKKLTLVK